MFGRNIPLSILNDIRQSADLQATTTQAAVMALREELIQLREQLRGAGDLEKVLHAQAAKDETTIRWMAARVNQLEGERAALLGRVTGMAMPYPEVTVETPTPPAQEGPLNPFLDQGPTGYAPPEEADMSFQGLDSLMAPPPDPFAHLEGLRSPTHPGPIMQPPLPITQMDTTYPGLRHTFEPVRRHYTVDDELQARTEKQVGEDALPAAVRRRHPRTSGLRAATPDAVLKHHASSTASTASRHSRLGAGGDGWWESHRGN